METNINTTFMERFHLSTLQTQFEIRSDGVFVGHRRANGFGSLKRVSGVSQSEE